MKGFLIAITICTYALVVLMFAKIRDIEKRVERIDHEWTLFYTELAKGLGVEVPK